VALLSAAQDQLQKKACGRLSKGGRTWREHGGAGCESNGKRQLTPLVGRDDEMAMLTALGAGAAGATANWLRLFAREDHSERRQVGETLPCGPPATSERLRRRRTFCGLDKELRNWDGQCLGETIQNVDGRVFLSPLKTTNVGPIYTSIKGQPLLREAASHSDSPQVPSHQRAPFHALRRALCWLLNHWPYPVNYGELPVQFGHRSTDPSGADGHAGPGGRCNTAPRWVRCDGEVA
jgi:hypothetical protein